MFLKVSLLRSCCWFCTKKRKVGLGRLKPCCDEMGKLLNYHSESDDSIVMMGPDELNYANNRGSCWRIRIASNNDKIKQWTSSLSCTSLLCREIDKGREFEVKPGAGPCCIVGQVGYTIHRRLVTGELFCRVLWLTLSPHPAIHTGEWNAGFTNNILVRAECVRCPWLLA